MVREQLRGDLIALYDGTVFRCHSASQCDGRTCCIHHPSEHPLRHQPLQWRGDMGGYVERVCSHGIGHPDPDDIMVRRYGAPGAHSCDGCCVGQRYGAVIPG